MRTAFPDAGRLRDDGDEGGPTAVARIVGDDATLVVETGEVDVLRVGAERIRLVRVFGQGHRLAGAHEQEGVAEREGGGDAVTTIG